MSTAKNIRAGVSGKKKKAEGLKPYRLFTFAFSLTFLRRGIF
jgi:hypothetical protein